MERSASTSRPRLALAVGVALAGAIAVVALGDPRRPGAPAPWVLTGWGLAVLALVPAGVGARGVGLVAAVVRALLLAAPAAFSDDVFRYVWEGRVWAAGLSPFVHAPDDPALAGLRDATWAQVNHRSVSSAYPPVAQLLFVALAPAGVLGWKLAMGLADVGTAVLLARRDPRTGWLWALLPLPALESAGSGHLEGVGVLLLVAALGGSRAAAWAGAMVKLLPGVVWLAQARGLSARAWLGWGALTLVALAPILAAGEGAWRGLETYRQTWAYHGSAHALAEALVGAAARPALQLVGVALAAWMLARSRDPARVALWVLGGFVILSPTVHPWYVLWPLAAALWTGTGAWALLAALVPLSYVVLGTYDPATSSWTEPTWTRWVVYLPFYAALAWEGWRRATRPGPWSVG